MILYLLIGLAAGTLIGWLIGKATGRIEWEKRNGQLQQQYSELDKELASYRATQTAQLINVQQQLQDKAGELTVSQQSLKESQQQLALSNTSLAGTKADLRALSELLQEKQKQEEQLKGELMQIKQEFGLASRQLASEKANNEALQDKLKTQKEEITEFRKTSQIEFENIANRVLREKTSEFTATNKLNIEAILKPLGEDIGKFKNKVEEVYEKEAKQRFSLEEKVKELIQQTDKVSEEANNLATALKGQSKKQGNWGEIILESILQKSGLVKDREYFVQQTIKDEEGKSLRPDIIVSLPDNRTIIIDSKVSLVAYDKFSSSDNPEEQNGYLADHLGSIYTHIEDLSAKKYDDLQTSLDFTMMFIPIEPAYLIAIQKDQELWSYAYSKRILLISPTNLIAALKLVADLWKREMQSKNAMEIVRRGELLYDKFVSFVETVEDIGKHISRTQNSYNTALAQLKTGSGNLVGQAMKMKNLGLKSTKEIPGSMMPFEPEGEEL